MKRFFKLSMFSCVVVAVLMVLFLKTAVAGVASPFQYNANHSFLAPNAGAPPPASLNGVAVVSPHDIWAVGSTTTNTGFQQTLIEHWNGQQWGVVPSPNRGVSASLNGVAVVSSHDVWAVGSSVNSTGTGHTLIEHWNGKQWSIVESA